MKLTAKGYLLYSLPFILSVVIAFRWGILETLGVFYGFLLLSVFTLGLPFLIFSLPYALYFFILQRCLKVSYKISILAFILTFAGFIMVIIGVQKFYEPIEMKMYFTNDKTNHLKERSLTLFEKEMGIRGQVKNIETTSRLKAWNEGDMKSTQERTYVIEVVPKDSFKDGSYQYVYIYKDGKWNLKRSSKIGDDGKTF